MLRSRHSRLQLELECAVPESISDNLPHHPYDISDWAVDPSIPLADEKFIEPASVDILFGASVFYHLLKGGRISLGESKPILQQTVLGWVVSVVCCSKTVSKIPALSLVSTLPEELQEPSLNELVTGVHKWILQHR